MTNLAEASLFCVGFASTLAVVIWRIARKPAPSTDAAEDAALARVLRRASDILEQHAGTRRESQVVSLDAYRRRHAQ